jgi:hypothetical protein
MRNVARSKVLAGALGFVAATAMFPALAQAASTAEPATYVVTAAAGDDGALGDDTLTRTSTAYCQPGDAVLSGGETLRSIGTGDVSRPVDSADPADADGWRVELYYGTSQAWVLCKAAGPAASPSQYLGDSIVTTNGDDGSLFCGGPAGARDLLAGVYITLSGGERIFFPADELAPADVIEEGGRRVGVPVEQMTGSADALVELVCFNSEPTDRYLGDSVVTTADDDGLLFCEGAAGSRDSLAGVYLTPVAGGATNFFEADALAPADVIVEGGRRVGVPVEQMTGAAGFVVQVSCVDDQP